jgi:hypothetical protein
MAISSVHKCRVIGRRAILLIMPDVNLGWLEFKCNMLRWQLKEK